VRRSFMNDSSLGFPTTDAVVKMSEQAFDAVNYFYESCT
jgi:hypothetical protein